MRFRKELREIKWLQNDILGFPKSYTIPKYITVQGAGKRFSH
jgi:hypothetical protein